jgi:sensor domain CHASE-containing protein
MTFALVSSIFESGDRNSLEKVNLEQWIQSAQHCVTQTNLLLAGTFVLRLGEKNLIEFI